MGTEHGNCQSQTRHYVTQTPPIAALNQEKAEQQAKLQELSKLEPTVKAFRKMVANVEDEKISRVVDLNMVRREKEELQSRLDVVECCWSDEKQELSAEMEQKEKEIKTMSETYNATIAKLKRSLKEHTQHQKRLQSEVEHLKDNLVSVSDVSTKAAELCERVVELEKAVEYHKTLVQEMDTKARLARQQWEEQTSAEFA